MGLMDGVKDFLIEAKADLQRLVDYEKSKYTPDEKQIEGYERKIKEIDEMLK